MRLNIPSSAKAWTGLSLRLILSGLFFKAGWDKVIDPLTFARSIQGYQMLPDAGIPWIAWVLPWLEIWCALALWFPPLLRRPAWMWIEVMLIAFTVAKVSAVLRGLDISCGCTSSETPLTWINVIENLGWILLTTAGLILDRRVLTPERGI